MEFGVTAKEKLMVRLERLAYLKSKPFCYGCYKEAPTGRCKLCGSDDLMRLLPGVAVEYGTDWIIREILRDVEAVDLEAHFEDMIRECYSETTKIGWLEYDTISAMKELDPISWDLACSEWVSEEESEENLISFDNGGTYFDFRTLESFLDECEIEKIA